MRLLSTTPFKLLIRPAMNYHVALFVLAVLTMPLDLKFLSASYSGFSTSLGPQEAIKIWSNEIFKTGQRLPVVDSGAWLNHCTLY